MDELLKAYTEVLKIHIGTKTKDKVFHEFTADVYEGLFDVFHRMSENLEDNKEGEYTQNDLNESKKRVYQIIEDIKEKVDGMKDKHSTGFNNIACDLTESLEGLCGTARGFIDEEEELEKLIENVLNSKDDDNDTNGQLD